MNDLKQMTEAEMREMDARVARDVMGWSRRTKAEAYGYDTTDVREPDDGLDELDNHWWMLVDGKWEEMAYVEDEGCCREDSEDGWKPGQNIAHAWSVVEKMRDTNPQIGFRLDVGPGILVDGKSYQFSAMFFYAGCGPWKVHIGADTAPLAICLAAISALEAKKGQQP